MSSKRTHFKWYNWFHRRREYTDETILKLKHPVRQKQMKNYTIKAEDENKEDVRGSSEDNSSKCKMCNGWYDLDECKIFNDISWGEKQVLVKADMLWLLWSHLTKTQQGTVQDEETVRFVWQSIQLAYMDTRFEGRMSKTIKPTSKMFSVNQLELEKFLACV